MKDTKTAEMKKEIGARLFAAAIAAKNIDSHAAAERLVKSVPTRKKMAVKTAADHVLEVVRHINRQRATRHVRRAAEAGIADINKAYDARKKYANRRIILRTGKQVLRSMVSECVRRAGLRTDCSGDYILMVKIGHPSATGKSEKGDQYSKTCTYRKTDAYHTITVATGWFRLPENLRVVDGLFNLSCELVEPGVYRATWVRQSRGFELATESGYIVVSEKYGTAHGKTISAARAIITQRRHAAQINGALARIKTELENFRAAGIGAVTVSLCDSLRAGNCAAGTAHWIAKHFPERNPQTDSATVAELIRITDQHRYVVAACLQAVRRQMKTIKIEA